MSEFNNITPLLKEDNVHERIFQVASVPCPNTEVTGFVRSVFNKLTEGRR